MNSQLIRIPVWDLPVRLFHWTVLGLVIGLWLTSQSNLCYDMTWHAYFGYGLLTLILFRITWGIWGSHYACFKEFVCGPKKVIGYIQHLFKPNASLYIGHNPLGAWSVLLLLTALLIQSGTGLFANDDLFTEGPLYGLIPKDWSDLLTKVHKFNFYIVLLGLIVVHVSAILFYRFVKKENLLLPMITGYKQQPIEQTVEYKPASLWRAGFLLGISAVAVYLILSIPDILSQIR